MVIEANPRASRTVPIVAKATGRDVVAAAVRCALGAIAGRGGPRAGAGAGRRARCGQGAGRLAVAAARASAPSSARRCARRARCWAWPPMLRRRTPSPSRQWRPTEADHDRRVTVRRVPYTRRSREAPGPTITEPEAELSRVRPELPSATGLPVRRPPTPAPTWNRSKFRAAPAGPQRRRPAWAVSCAWRRRRYPPYQPPRKPRPA